MGSLNWAIIIEFIKIRELPPSAGFPSPSGGVAPSAAVKDIKVAPASLLGGASGAHSLKNFRRVMRIPNMCLVLKLYNGKVFSIADKQTES